MSAHDNSFIPVCEPTMNGNELLYVTDAVNSGWVSSGGSYLERFEKLFPPAIGADFGVAACNGTTALHLALVAAGVGPDDEVIVPSFTMVASATAVVYCGATPVFVDCDPLTWTIDPLKLEKAITPKTKAVMTVSVYGHPSDFDAVRSVLEGRNIFWLEDGAESHGALYKGRPVGTFADATAYSFFANKIISTGEGGMVCTNQSDYADRCRVLRNLGFSLKGPRNYVHEVVGFNYRMTNLQAALGCAQLERFDALVEGRRSNARCYNERLSHLSDSLQLPVEMPWAKNCYWMYGIVLRDSKRHDRNAVMRRLKEHNIDTRPFFHPMHLQPIFSGNGSMCPVAEKLGQNGFYLPSSSHLREDQVEYICDRLKTILSD